MQACSCSFLLYSICGIHEASTRYHEEETVCRSLVILVLVLISPVLEMSSESGDDIEVLREEDEQEFEDMEVSEETANVNNETPRVYLPGDPLEEGEQLVCDETAYVMLHEAQSGSPCLSFDVIKNPWHEISSKFPATVYIVAGTQAPQTHANSIIVMKMSNLHKTEENDDDESDESSDEDNEEKNADLKSPKMKCSSINHLGCVNRIRCSVNENVVLAASWSELGRVNIWDIATHLKNIDKPSSTKKEEKFTQPLFSFKGHLTEGYALDWSGTVKGMLASGDCKQNIHIWHPSEGTWQVDQRPLIGHKASVEDLQWSPNEANVLASCSVDKSIRIWDIRSPPNKANKLTVEDAHELDVNVISWNNNEPFIVSGGDDGILNIWDLRQFKNGSSVAKFKHHTQQVTTVEWHPTDGTVFASGGADNQIALWDIAVEYDAEDNSDELEKLPSQLLFIHQGQTDIKELHWHPEIPGVLISTALSGFNVFKTISV